MPSRDRYLDTSREAPNSQPGHSVTTAASFGINEDAGNPGKPIACCHFREPSHGQVTWSWACIEEIAQCAFKLKTMVFTRENPENLAPDRFVVEVFSELGASTIQRRWREVNAILRLSMLVGLPMEMDAALSMLSDLAVEIVGHDSALMYLWDENSEQMLLRCACGLDRVSEPLARGNVLNFWVNKYGRPLLVSRGAHPQADLVLAETNSQSALVVPLMVNNRALGSIQLFSKSTGVFSNEDAQLLWILALVSENMLSREQANEGLLTFAFTDYLTGLKTRGYFEQQLDLELKRCERKSTALSLLMLDIDYFKSLNDHYGHHVGDQVLRDMSSLLTKDMRSVDTVARYGGEEFVIILPETPAPLALRVAQRIRHRIEQAKFFAGSAADVEKLTISIGIAVYPHDVRFKQDLIETADAALYHAKSQGRNQVMLYADLVRQQREVS